MIKIFVEDNELDISQDLSNQITYAIDDLNNLDSKQTAISKTIILPGTAKNNRLLGNIFDIGNANNTNDTLPNIGYNFNASKAARAYIEANGLQSIKGVMRLMEIINDRGLIEYEVFITGELGGFVSAVGNKRLEDLDFSAYNHSYSYANIVNSWNFTAGSGYVYPLIDYGNQSTNKHDFQYKTFRPALFVREYIDKIITGAGYTWESNFFNTALFKRLIIPNNSKFLSSISSTGLDVSGPVQAYGPPISYQPITLSTLTALGPFTTPDNQRFTNAGGVTINGTFTLHMTGDFFNDLDGNIVISIRTSGAGAQVSYYFPEDDKQGGNDPYDITLTLPCSLNNGDYVIVEMVIPDSSQFYQFNINTVSLRFTLSASQPVPLNINEPVIMNDTIPRGIFQKDFFASILKMFYLMVTEDKFKTKHLIIEPWVDFFDTSLSSYEDWTLKMDRSKPIRTKPMSELNARYYQLKYKQDSDFYNEDYRKKYNEGYGDRIYDNQFEFSKDTETVEVIFAASPLYGTAGEDKVFPAIYKKSNNNSAEDSMEHIIRIMQVKKITGVSSWAIKNGSTVLTSQTSYCYAGHLDDPDAPNADINFGAPKELYFALATGNLSNNLFNAYYSPYMAEITDKDSKLLTAFFRLTDLDIYNLKFSTFKFIDGVLFRISKVVDFVPGGNDVTQVQLLKTIYTTY